MVFSRDSQADDNSADFDFFEQRIRPALIDNCYSCHSGKAKKVGGGLLLDSRAGTLKGGDSGSAVVPGDPGKSLLMEAIRHAGLEMPPDRKLPDKTIADFEEWIMQGAPDPRREEDAATPAEAMMAAHWAFQPVSNCEVPSVNFSDELYSDIDHFILAELERHELKPAAPADRRTLIRRVTFAITGLPPTPEEVRGFLEDQSQKAFENVVDRLLGSPQFGERWARHWMDLVRYAETRGHEADYAIPNAYQYRDYLIRAFNSDLPYDQFVIEHLAGDLIKPPRLRPGTEHNESILATGWAFLGDEIHAPVDIRQDELERIDNKVDVFGKTFLGLTISCARCHDHKFDPVTQEDYYALCGFILSSSYRQVRFESMEHNGHVAEQLAVLRAGSADHLAHVVTNAQQSGLKNLADYLVAAGSVLRSERDDEITATANRKSLDRQLLRQWVKVLRKAESNVRDPFYPLAAVSNGDEVDGAGFHKKLKTIVATWPDNAESRDTPHQDSRSVVDFSDPGDTTWMVDGFAFGGGPVGIGDFGVGDTSGHPVTRVFAYAAARRDPFWKRLRIAKNNQLEGGYHGATLRSGRMIRTPTFQLSSGRVHCLMVGSAKVYAGVDSHIMVRPPRHNQLMIDVPPAQSTGPRWVTLDLTRYSGHRVHLEFGSSLSRELEILKIVETPQTPRPWGHLNRLVLRMLKNESVRSPDDLATAYQRLFISASNRLSKGDWTDSADDRDFAELADWLVRHHDLIVPISSPQRKRLAQAARDFITQQEKLAKSVRWESRTAVSWWDGNAIDEAVLVRGDYRNPDNVVPRRLPSVFPESSPIKSSGSGRLELAKQLVKPSNPLLARVIVNRAWHHLFGQGIVQSVDNFGLQGRRPSHPQLLDYLTHQFVTVDRWSLKKLLRRLVLSLTYRMSSLSGNTDFENIDPGNELRHRMSLVRLEGEAIRDSVLAVSGRLDLKTFGTSVPLDFTDDIAISRGAPARRGPLDGLGRRSVYLEVRRNIPSNMMSAFDTPIPFSTVGRRGMTNVPGQALVLMNDQFIYEQANVWAKRLLAENQTFVLEDRILEMYETALGRPPSAHEKAAFAETAEALARLHGRSHIDETVLTELCHVFFNMNEFIYIR